MNLKSTQVIPKHCNGHGVTLMVLAITIVVVLLLVGVIINILFSNEGIVKITQERVNGAQENENNSINEFNNWLNSVTDNK